MEWELLASSCARTRLHPSRPKSASMFPSTFSVRESVVASGEVARSRRASKRIGHARPDTQPLLLGSRRDPSREVVDHCVELSPRAIRQPDDGDVDVPQLVRGVGTDAPLGLRGTGTAARPSPPALWYQPRPCGRRRDRLSNTLRVENCHHIRIGRAKNRCIPREGSMNSEASPLQRLHLRASRETAARATMVRRHDPREWKRLGRHREAGAPRAKSRARPLCASSSSV
jgi:hypothetical protein